MNELSKPNSPSRKDVSKMFLYGQNKIITMPLILMDFLKIICYKTCAINIEN